MQTVRSTFDPARAFEGKTFGSYRIARAIATGGMATVFLARKSGPGRFSQTAAIKIVHPHLATQPEFIDMFLDEARIASCISHPNVCRVLDFGEAEGTYFLAMEYVNGETWADSLKAMFADDEARRYMSSIASHVIAQACEGLHAAHEGHDSDGAPLHIVHRDVSPHNLFVAYDGTVRVLDFGIASAADKLHTTRGGTVKGRYAFMSPEQMRAEPLDRRADIWSLGVILRESITGKRLFRRDSDTAVISAVTTDPLPPWDDNIPQRLRDICDKALQRDRTKRYDTAREMGQELTRYIASMSVPYGSIEVSGLMRRLFAPRMDEKRVLLQLLSRSDLMAPQTPSAGYLALPGPSRDGPPSVSAVRAVAHESDPPLASLSVPPARHHTEAPVRRTRLALAIGMPVVSATVIAAWMLLSRAPVVDPPLTAFEANRVEQASAGPAVMAPAPSPALPADLPTSAEPAFVDPAAATAADPLAAPSTPEAPVATKRHRREAGHDKAPASQAAAAASTALAAGGSGTLIVAASQGWADVFVAGKHVGTTPGRFELPVGTQTVLIKPYGADPGRRERVTITRDQTTKLKLDL